MVNQYDIGVLSQVYDPPLAIGTGFNGWTSTIRRWKNFLYVCGNFTQYNGVARNYICRLHLDGTLDTDFVPVTLNGNVVHMDVDPATGYVYMYGGFTTIDGNSSPNIGSLTNTGAWNSTFNVGLGTVYNYGGIAFHNDTIYLTGGFTSYRGTAANRVVGINLDGTIKAGFNYGTGFNNSTYTGNMANGDFLIGGLYTTYQGASKTYLCRIAPDGSARSGYGGIMSGRVYAACYDERYDNCYAVSYASTSFKRIKNDGTNDTAFAAKSVGGYPQSLCAIGGNKVLIAGPSSYDGYAKGYLYCVNADGTRNTAFDISAGGANQSGSYGWNIMCYQPLVNKVYYGGKLTSYNGTAKNYLVKINTLTGALDMA